MFLVLSKGGGGKNFQNSIMAVKLSPSEELDMEYKERVPVFPKEIDNKRTNLFLAAQVTRIPVKASTSIKARASIWCHFYYRLKCSPGRLSNVQSNIYHLRTLSLCIISCILCNISCFFKFVKKPKNMQYYAEIFNRLHYGAYYAENFNISFCLQIDDPEVPRGERTFRLLCSIMQKNHQMCRDEWLPQFVETHRGWIENVTRHHFEITGKDLDKFLRTWLIRAYPLNEIGIFILARFLHGHVAIFCNEKWWNTRKDGDISKVNAILVYRGNLVFDDTRLMSTSQYSEVKEEVRRYKLQVERHNKKIEEEEKRKAKEKEQKEKAKAAARVSPPRHFDKDTEQDLDLEALLDNNASDNSEKIPHNIDQPDQDIMQKMDDKVPSKDSDSDTVDGEDIMRKEETAPTGNIMQKNENEDFSSDDNLTLAAVLESERNKEIPYEEFKEQVEKDNNKKTKKKTKKKKNKKRKKDKQQNKEEPRGLLVTSTGV